MPQDIWQDARFAARLLVKDRRLTAAALVALALGIAANTTVFTIINTALWKDLPFERPEQIMALGSRDERGRELGVSYPDFLDWRSATRAFASLSANANAAMNLSEDASIPQRYRGAFLSANALTLLRVEPILGRGFLESDEQPGAPPVVLLGHDLWVNRYAGDAGVLGRIVRVNDLPSTVIGVMPAGFAYPGTAELWQPLSLLPGITSVRRDTRTLGVNGRLADGVSAERARAELTLVAERLAADRPETNRGIRPIVRPPLEPMRQGTKPQLMALMGAVVFVLLIACASVANLLLARAAHRSHEIAVRASLGATRFRIVRQLLIESLLLSAVAGAIGLGLSVYGVKYFGVAFDAIETGAPDRMATPYWVDLTMDGTVFAFVAGLCLGSSILFGLAPALHITRASVNDVLKEGGRGAAGNVRARRWTGALMIGELALTLVLLAGAGLFARGFFTLYRTNLIIDTSDLFTVRLGLSSQRYPSPAEQQAFVARLDERLAANPVIPSAAIAGDIPFVPLGTQSRPLLIEGRSPIDAAEPPGVSYLNIGPRYFETLGLPLVQGRTFNARDGLPGQETAIVNQSFAARFFPGESSLDRRIRLAAPTAPEAPWLTIVGVSPTLPRLGLQVNDIPVVHVPIRGEAAPFRFASIIVRRGSPSGMQRPFRFPSGNSLETVVGAVREEVRAIDPNLPLYSIQTLDATVARARFPVRIIGSLYGLLAGIALVLATVGLYGLTAHTVAQRSREIGIRMALGARMPHVLWLFMRRTLVQLSIGLAVGFGGTWMVGRFIQAFLVQSSPPDALTVGAVTALLIVVSLAASYVPARRAARLDPAAVLRAE